MSLSWKHLTQFLILFILVETNVFGATVTVDPQGVPAPGSVYTTILAAFKNLPAGPESDGWGDGNDVVDLVDTSIHLLGAEVDVTLINNGSVTLRNAPGTEPVVALDPSSIPTYGLVVHRSGHHTIEGITFIGPKGVDADTAGNRDLFRIESNDNLEEVHATIRNCVMTANDGNDAPLLDFGAPNPNDRLGCIGRLIHQGRSAFAGRVLSITVEHCVLAYTSGNDAAILMREPAQDPESVRKLAILNTAIVNHTRGSGLRFDNIGNESTVFIKDSVFALCKERAVIFRGTEASPELSVFHSIIDQVGGAPAINSEVPFWGSMSFEQVTFNRGDDLVVLGDQYSGDGNFVFRDVIAVAGSPLFRISGGFEPGLLVVEHVAANPPYSIDQAQSVQDAFAADFGGTGPLTADPQFSLTTFDSSLAGIRAWNSMTNTYYDVGNVTDFAGQAHNGSDLTGGAELVGATNIDGWCLY